MVKSRGLLISYQLLVGEPTFHFFSFVVKIVVFPGGRITVKVSHDDPVFCGGLIEVERDGLVGGWGWETSGGGGGGGGG